MEQTMESPLLKKVYAEEPSLRIAKYDIVDSCNDIKNKLIAYVSQSDKRDFVLNKLKEFQDLVKEL